MVNIPNQFDIYRFMILPIISNAKQAGWLSLALVASILPVLGNNLSKLAMKQAENSSKAAQDMAKELGKKSSNKRLADANVKAELRKQDQQSKAAIAQVKQATAAANKPLKEQEAKNMAEKQKIDATANTNAAVTRAKGAAEAKKTRSKGKVKIVTTAAKANAQVSVDKKQTETNKDNITKEAAAQKTVIVKKGELKNAETTQKMRNDVQLAQIASGYKKIEANLSNEGAKLKLKDTHLQTTKPIIDEITKVAESALKGAQGNSGAAKLANAALSKLNEAEKELLGAHEALYLALDASQKETNAYQLQAATQSNTISQTTEQGRADIHKENTLADKEFKTIASKTAIDITNGKKIIEAFLNVYKAEHNAKNKLDISKIEQFSRTKLTKEVQEKILPMLNQKLAGSSARLAKTVDEKLATFNIGDLKVLSEKIKQKKSELTISIQDKPGENAEHNKTIENLEKLAKKINVIIENKPSQGPRSPGCG